MPNFRATVTLTVEVEVYVPDADDVHAAKEDALHAVEMTRRVAGGGCPSTWASCFVDWPEMRVRSTVGRFARRHVVVEEEPRGPLALLTGPVDPAWRAA